MEIIKNTSYDYIVSYVRANGFEYRIKGHRLTSKGGAVFDGDGKCLQHTFQFAGWRLTEYRIIRDDNDRIFEEKQQVWLHKDGTRFTGRRFENKTNLMEWVAKYLDKFEEK